MLGQYVPADVGVMVGLVVALGARPLVLVGVLDVVVHVFGGGLAACPPRPHASWNERSERREGLESVLALESRGKRERALCNCFDTLFLNKMYTKVGQMVMLIISLVMLVKPSVGLSCTCGKVVRDIFKPVRSSVL